MAAQLLSTTSEMFSTKALNHKMCRHYEKRLRALVNDGISTFKENLSKSNDTAVHVQPCSTR